MSPVQCRHLDRFPAFPGLAVDDLRLVQPVDGFGQRVVVAITLATHRRLDSGLGQTLSVTDGDILTASVAVMNQVT